LKPLNSGLANPEDLWKPGPPEPPPLPSPWKSSSSNGRRRDDAERTVTEERHPLEKERDMNMFDNVKEELILFWDEVFPKKKEPTVIPFGQNPSGISNGEAIWALTDSIRFGESMDSISKISQSGNAQLTGLSHDRLTRCLADINELGAMPFFFLSAKVIHSCLKNENIFPNMPVGDFVMTVLIDCAEVNGGSESGGIRDDLNDKIVLILSRRNWEPIVVEDRGLYPNILRNYDDSWMCALNDYDIPEYFVLKVQNFTFVTTKAHPTRGFFEYPYAFGPPGGKKERLIILEGNNAYRGQILPEAYKVCAENAAKAVRQTEFATMAELKEAVKQLRENYPLHKMREMKFKTIRTKIVALTDNVAASGSVGQGAPIIRSGRPGKETPMKEIHRVRRFKFNAVLDRDTIEKADRIVLVTNSTISADRLVDLYLDAIGEKSALKQRKSVRYRFFMARPTAKTSSGAKGGRGPLGYLHSKYLGNKNAFESVASLAMLIDDAGRLGKTREGRGSPCP
jgi:hypothetical protein